MQISKLAAKPKLINIVIDDKELADKYRKEYKMKEDEMLEFHTWDRLPMDTFNELVNIDTENESELFKMVMPLMLDEDGNEVMADGAVLPQDVLVGTITAITKTLGKK